jgi:RES domain-containing protein
MICYRIAKCNFVDDLSGAGARLYGGRWNNVGKSMVYMASSRPLAVLEVLVHLPATILPSNYCICEIQVPEISVLEVNQSELPADWQDISGPAYLKYLGDKFIKEGKYLLMKVPSAILREEFNYLLNPQHEQASEVKIISKKTFGFDQRLV